jgi:3-oxoacyl-ACP reductase-like protein
MTRQTRPLRSLLLALMFSSTLATFGWFIEVGPSPSPISMHPNEIMGDVQGEFSSAPDKGEGLPLEELGTALGSGHSGNLGKYQLVLCRGPLAASFNISSAKAHLSKTWGLCPQRTDAVLLMTTTMEPAKHLGSDRG